MATSIISEGTIQTTQQIILTPAAGKRTLISNIKINNTNANPYIIELKLLYPNNNSSRRLFKFFLNAGDIVDDDTQYELDVNCSIQALTDQPNAVDYVISGEIIPA